MKSRDIVVGKDGISTTSVEIRYKDLDTDQLLTLLRYLNQEMANRYVEVVGELYSTRTFLKDAYLKLEGNKHERSGESN